MKFIETNQELLRWPKSNNLIIPVLSNPFQHWALNQVSFVYFYNLNLYTEAIVSINHNDSENLQISVLSDFLGQDNYIYQKKYLSDSAANYDAQMAFWLQSIERFDHEIPFVIRSYWNQFKGYDNINDCVPIMKWLEWCREMKDKFVLTVKDYEANQTLKDYDLFLTNLSKIEKNGIYTR